MARFLLNQYVASFLALLALFGLGICHAMGTPKSTKTADDTCITAPSSSSCVAQKLDPDAAEGKQLMETHCSRCHAVPAPDSHSLSEWPAILNQMAPRAQLLPADRAKIEAYLRASIK